MILTPRRMAEIWSHGSIGVKPEGWAAPAPASRQASARMRRDPMFIADCGVSPPQARFYTAAGVYGSCSLHALLCCLGGNGELAGSVSEYRANCARPGKAAPMK